MSLQQQIQRQREDFARQKAQIQQLQQTTPEITQRQLRQGSAQPLMGRLQRRGILQTKSKLVQAKQQLEKKERDFEIDVARKAPEYAKPSVIKRLASQAKAQIKRELERLDQQKDDIKRRGGSTKAISKKIRVYEEALKLKAGTLIQAVETGKIEKISRRKRTIGGLQVEQDTLIEVGGQGYSVAPELQQDFANSFQKVRFPTPKDWVQSLEERGQSIAPELMPKPPGIVEKGLTRLSSNIERFGREFIDRPLERAGISPEARKIRFQTNKITDIKGIPIYSPLTVSVPAFEERISFKNLYPNIPIKKQPPTIKTSTKSTINQIEQQRFKNVLESEATFGQAVSGGIETGIWFTPIVGEVRAGLEVAMVGEKTYRGRKTTPLEIGTATLLVGGGALKGISKLKQPSRAVFVAGQRGKQVVGIGVLQPKTAQALRAVGFRGVAGKIEKPFAFVDEELARAGKFTVSKGGQIRFKAPGEATRTIGFTPQQVEAGDLLLSEQLAATIAKTPKGRELTAARGTAIQKGDIAFLGGTAFDISGRPIKFVGGVRRLPEPVESFSLGQRLVKPIKTQRVQESVQKAITEQIGDVKVLEKTIPTLVKPSPAVQEITTRVQTRERPVPREWVGVYDVPFIETVAGNLPRTTSITMQNFANSFRRAQREEFKQIQKQRQRQISQLKQVSLPKIKESFKTRQALRVGTKSATSLKPLQTQLTTQRTIPKTTPRTTIKQIRTQIVIPKIGQQMRQLGKLAQAQTKAYKLFIKRFGKFDPVGEFTRGEALLKGQKITRETLAATFKIEPTKRLISKKDFDVTLGKEFRTFKIKKGKKIPLGETFIQKRKYRLGTKGEVSEILGFKKKKKRRKKR